MADLVMLAEVNHATSFLEKEFRQEIPIRLVTVIFRNPDDNIGGTMALRERVQAEAQVYIPTPRRLPIERGDKIVIEGAYREDRGDYDIQRIHLLWGSQNGKNIVLATFRSTNLNPYQFKPIDPEAIEELCLRMD
ncbi:MAG: hypothetical protein KKB21_00855 [Nanoarchaeota archaeon]|nr:hypothetical protein [Nanoarchaeota archaeon]MBU4086105.1 hypothetical protein [Nanoarchaeota archaeon]